MKSDKIINIPAKTLAALVRLYQIIISPLFPNSCRFYPSCSEYTRQALITHGAIKGTALGMWRILRCNPWGKGGYDPVNQR
ncbi:MAG: membrane protein insertion efficiency factor YidD [candidate division Zixibacteria bacterium]|nr:membrane protein insertion efficiency factor YidD [candidate division Zixibacteria bacterium]